MRSVVAHSPFPIVCRSREISVRSGRGIWRRVRTSATRTVPNRPIGVGGSILTSAALYFSSSTVVLYEVLSSGVGNIRKPTGRAGRCGGWWRAGRNSSHPMAGRPVLAVTSRTAAYRGVALVCAISHCPHPQFSVGEGATGAGNITHPIGPTADRPYSVDPSSPLATRSAPEPVS